MENSVRGAVTPADMLAGDWDYVIVGAGSAGCVVARRLSDDPSVRVLLIEAGAAETDPDVFVPQMWPMLAGGVHDWKYGSVTQPGLNGRTVTQPRGKGLGGSSLINAMGFQRGSHAVYDDWAEATGDQGWSFAGLLPYFRRMERASGGADAWRGDEGPLDILALGQTGGESPFAHATAAAGVAAGFPLNPDWSGAEAEGTIWSQLTMRDGRRVTAASAYLDPVRDRANLGICTSAEVRRLRIADGCCTGVEIGDRIVAPRREVILCAGAIDTPRLLMLSGVGDGAHLRDVGIDPVHHLPDVGQNLADHPLVPGLLFQAKQPLPPSAYNHCETMVIARSGQARGRADLQVMILAVPFLSPDLGAPPPDSFAIVPSLIDPRSRGSIRLASADPAVPALIDPGYLSDPRDVEALVDGFAIARDVARQPALEPWIAGEVIPGSLTDRAALGEHIRRTASPFFHPVSTCRMGRSGSSVVDSACRVHGLEGLRIVDASVFPSIPNAMTNAAVVVVAERASDLIRGS